MDTTYVPILFYYSKTNFSITSVISEALMMFFNLGRSWQPQSETILGILRSWIDFSSLLGLVRSSAQCSRAKFWFWLIFAPLHVCYLC
jgi:hypothetical protein